MRNKKKNITSDIAAQDLAITYLRNEMEGLRRSVVTIKKAVNAPLALWETVWFDALHENDQRLINKAADLIARSLRPAPAQPIINTVTSTTATTVTTKRVRVKADNANQRWSKSEDAIIKKMRKAGKTNQEIAKALGRSEKAVMNRYTTLKKG